MRADGESAVKLCGCQAIAFERATGGTNQKARDEAGLAAAVQAVHKTFDANPDVCALVVRAAVGSLPANELRILICSTIEHAA